MNLSVTWSSLLIVVYTGIIVSASDYHQLQQVFKELLSKFSVPSKEFNPTWTILLSRVPTSMIIYEYSDTFSKPYVKQEWRSNETIVCSCNLRLSTLDTFSAAMVFDPTPKKSKQSSWLRPRQFENNLKVSSGWYSTMVVMYPTSPHLPVL